MNNEKISHSKHRTRNNLIALGTTAVGAATIAVLGIGINNQLNNRASDKTTVTDAGDLANSTPPSLTTPDGKQVVIPTTIPEPTATPTPEAPKTVAWSADQIRTAQNAALADGKIALLDTWTVDDGEAKSGKTGIGNSMIFVDTPTGSSITFKSPFNGTIEKFINGTTTDNRIVKEIVVVTGTRHIIIVFNNVPNSAILVTVGQSIDAGAPLVNTDGNKLPPGVFGKNSNNGQVALFEDVSVPSGGIDTQNVLKDSKGVVISLAK